MGIALIIAGVMCEVPSQPTWFHAVFVLDPQYVPSTGT